MAEPYKNTEPLLKVEHLKKYYPQNRPIFGRPTSWIRAADDVSLELYQGETLGLVGESGCGKSTLGRMIAGLEAPDSGRIWYKGQELTAKGGRGYSAVRTEIQMVFQDSYSSLNPRKQIFQILSEPMLYHSLADKHTVHKKAEHLMELVGLPLSALDVSIQAQILNLLKSLQKELDLTCIFIGHGLGAVNYVSRRIAVMYLGKLVETGESSELFEHPVHPYTRTLLGAVPIPDPRKREENWGETSEGTAYEPSSTGAEDKGCPFKDRCFRKRPECSSAEVPLRPVRPGSTHLAACSPAVLEVKRNE